MKRIIFTLFFISLVATKELEKIHAKEIQKNGEDTKIKMRNLSAAAVGTFLVKKAIDIGVSYLIGKLFDHIGEMLDQSHFTSLYKDNGNGKYISNIKNGYVVSMYFHKTKVHTATCDGGVLGGGTISAIADPGEWAIAYCKAGISGRRTYYNHF